MGTILVVSYFNLKQGKRDEFVKWLKEWEEPMRRSLARYGAKLLGTYMGTMGLAPADGMTLIEYSSYEDLDVLRESDNPEMERMMTSFEALTERCAVSGSLWEQTPDGLSPVVARKHQGKRLGK